MLNWVLVHGAWQDGSCWASVARQLRQAGHRVHCPTLAGHGPGADRTVCHQDCTDSLVRFVRARRLSRVILLGHSFGGTVIARASEVLHTRIRQLVFLSAFVLKDGQCLLDELTAEQRALILRLSRASPDRSVPMPRALWCRQFMNDAPLDTARRWHAELFPEPIRCLSDRLPLKRFHALKVHKSFLHATGDQTLPPGPDCGWHPHMSRRLGCHRLIRIPGSHEALLTRPGPLSRALLRLATI